MKKLILIGIAVVVASVLPLKDSMAGVYVSTPGISFQVRWAPGFDDTSRYYGYYPGRGYGNRMWVPGYWQRIPGPITVWKPWYRRHRNGYLVWVPGHWQRTPSPKAFWGPPGTHEKDSDRLREEPRRHRYYDDD